MKTKEIIIKMVFLCLALVSIFSLAFIAIFLFKEGLPIFKKVSLKAFLFGKEWYPTDEPPAFGILPLIIGSLVVTLLSSLIAVPLGVLSAIYISELARPFIKEILKPLIELLAALPSVVIGLFGMTIIAPFLQKTFNLSTGLNAFNASLMLALMSIPTITSISEDALHNVPSELREASFALGATKWETIYYVVVPAALSGIGTAVILGIARALGETMVVLMVAGGAAWIPESIFDPVRPMPAAIAAEMGEAPVGSEHYHALFAIGLVLFFFTLGFNLIAYYIAQKYKKVGEAL
ncbi:Phosphate transport system permease protein PstC [Candidatus Methanoperedenaceae archaeon GB50]|nr:Phosphate transport system permease protein PstC [Candidatus Methanoperedenaceae archaeon GB50]CAD7775140.1 Phosphate transport system permease protein PstC [Candidatus Methanoperedenaceae archaeon GB37]CAD7775670.1 MAG: Phosphate transport system permease protein PstC [Candidatus Methanoperedenaceae archaeon GB37]